METSNEKVVKQMRELHDKFAKENGHTPKFAHVMLLFDGDEEFEASEYIIKLRDFDPNETWNDPDDGNVIFYADGINELCGINTDHTTDFIITEIFGFYDDIY